MGTIRSSSTINSDNNVIPNIKIDKIFKQLDDLEKTNFFFRSNCNLYTTAKRIKTNTSYLSKIINTYKLKSFNAYINELRIKYCIKKLNTDKKFRAYTIKAISTELGYKSVNTFASAFKKQTGISHSYYLKSILDNKPS